jgi:hypothetical protein
LAHEEYVGVKQRTTALSSHHSEALLSALGEFSNPPSHVWPDDRRWCLCGDIDWAWAYVAGSTPCIAELTEEPLADAYPTMPGNPARFGMDIINDPEGIIQRRF